jgi:hypothetical protein
MGVLWCGYFIPSIRGWGREGRERKREGNRGREREKKTET